jgi:hypothetical protein
LSRYNQNLNSLKSKSKKYIENVTKVSKLFDLRKESEEIIVNRSNQNLYLEEKIVPVLQSRSTKIEVDGLDDGVYLKQKGMFRIKEKIIPQDSINMCINYINNYSTKYIAKLLGVSHINPKRIDTYIIRDSSNIMIWPNLKDKIISKDREILKRQVYCQNSKIALFFIKLFNNMLALPIITHLKNQGVAPGFLRWIFSDNNMEYYPCIEVKNNTGNIYLLKDYIVGYLDEIVEKGNCIYIKEGIVTLPVQVDLELLDNKITPLGIGMECFYNNYGIKNGNIRVLKIESAEFMLLLNLKSFSTYFLSGKGELQLLDKFKVQKSIIESELWDILNLYLINNELYSHVLDSLKKQVVSDYSLAKDEIIEPEMLSLYQDKIHNITYQVIFKILNNEWYDIKWFISFKFDTVFLDEHRSILIKNIEENINDDYLFLNLIKNMFNMKMIGIDNYKSMSKYNIFKHDKLSEFLINIFFCILDKKVNDLKYNFFDKYYFFKLKNKCNDNQILARDVNTKVKFNFKYIRYLDTFIIGINGTKSEVNEIREVLDSFLKSELKLNNLHSYITDIHNDDLKFMNINISSGLYYDNKYKILFLFPKQLIIKALINSGILNNKKIPICKTNLLKYNLNIIINTYIDINYFILGSFTVCHDFFKLNRLLSYYINCSLKLTIQTKLGNELWGRVLAPITYLRRDLKTYGINNSWKIVYQRSSRYMIKRLGQSNLNILSLFRLGLISSKTFKKLYYFRVNNKKFFKRKYVNKNWDYNINNINWESDINFDFLISNYYDSSTSFAYKSHVTRVGMKILSLDYPRPPL